MGEILIECTKKYHISPQCVWVEREWHFQYYIFSKAHAILNPVKDAIT